MIKPLFNLGFWFLALFNPPPRESLSFLQKVVRVFVVTLALLCLCFVAALAATATLSLGQQLEAARVGSFPLIKALAILAGSLLASGACVFVLLQIKRLDEKLVPMHPTTAFPKL